MDGNRDAHHEQIPAGAQRGDLLLFRSWFPGKTHRWVKALREEIAGADESIPPEAPTLHEPLHNVVLANARPRLSWYPAHDPSGLGGYEVQINKTRHEAGVEPVFVAPQPLPTGTHTWRVRGDRRQGQHRALEPHETLRDPGRGTPSHAESRRAGRRPRPATPKPLNQPPSMAVSNDPFTLVSGNLSPPDPSDPGPPGIKFPISISRPSARRASRDARPQPCVHQGGPGHCDPHPPRPSAGSRGTAAINSRPTARFATSPARCLTCTMNV